MSIYSYNFYSTTQQTEEVQKRWFDEGPVIIKKYDAINTSSIQTSEIDVFRQGVEITQNKHFIGTFKISAGTPGHIVKPTSYGVNNFDIISENSYVETDYFDPIAYMQAQEFGGELEDLITFPIVIGDSNQLENVNFNGIIEPFSIRPVISFYSIEWPFESHSVKGDFVGGNTRKISRSNDRILSIDDFYDDSNSSWYLDSFDLEGSDFPVKREGYLNFNLETLKPWDDTTVYLKKMGIDGTKFEDFQQTFQEMTGTTGNYIEPGKRSACCGFVYDGSTVLGTDSIVFGGLGY